MNRAQEYKYFRSKTANYKYFAKNREKYLKPFFKNFFPKKILELGCGEGSLGYIIKALTDAQVFGVDYSISGTKLSKEKGIIAQKADLNKRIPFRGNYFDLIISDQLIEHIENTDVLMEESFRVLKKGGYQIIITPNLSYWLNRFLFVIGVYPIFLEVSSKDKTLGQGFIKRYLTEQEVMGHIRVFNLPALVDLLTQQGFVVEKKIGIPLSFNSDSRFMIIYNILDTIFARRTSLARDLMVIARKP